MCYLWTWTWTRVCVWHSRAAAQTDSDPTISRLTQMQSLEWSRGTEGTNKGRKMTRDVVAAPSANQAGAD